MKLWFLKLKNTQKATRSWSKRFSSWKMPKEIGWLFGLKKARKKSEEPQIWYKRASNVLLTDVWGLMVQMYHWTCIWSSSTIVEQRPRDKLWQSRSVWLNRKAWKLRQCLIFLPDIWINSGRASESRIWFEYEKW